MNLSRLFRQLNAFAGIVPPRLVNRRRNCLSSIGHGLESLEERRLLAGVPEMLSVNPTGAGSSISKFVESNNAVFFFADDLIHGSALWKTDGTHDGTVLVKEIAASVNPYSPNPEMIDLNGMLFFTADDGTHGIELWKSDGTTEGTVLVKDIAAGADSSRIGSLTVFGNSLFFSANDGQHGNELWRSDGTPDGTVMVKDISDSEASPNSYPSGLTAVNGTLFFSAWDTEHGLELWKSNGSTEGTVSVKDINGGKSDGYARSTSFYSWGTANGKLFFVAKAGRSALWTSDGTEEGTVRLHIASRSNSCYSLPEFGTLNGTVYFSSPNDSDEADLWKTDGTTAGTALVKSGLTCTYSVGPTGFTSAGDQLCFRVLTKTSQQELWTADGTEAGTIRLKTDSAGFLEAPGTAVDSTLYFRFHSNASGPELWKSDGTRAGTIKVADPNPGAVVRTELLTQAIEYQGHLLFTADDGSHGLELWKSDGTEAGTLLVKDINATSRESIFSTPYNIPVDIDWVNHGGSLFFTGSDPIRGKDLWKTDGTAAGTSRVATINPQGWGVWNISYASGNGALFFSADGQGLWKTDGTEPGTEMLSSAGVQELTTSNDTAFFVKLRNTAGGQWELWKTDGTEGGTVRLYEHRGDWVRYLTDVAGTLYYVSGSSLWKSDGTQAGTERVASFSEHPQSLTNVDGTLFFSGKGFGDSFRLGTELWKSDGTQAGTVMVKDIHPTEFQGSYPNRMINVDGTLFFSANTKFANYGGFNWELWKSDGTEEGTLLVKEIWPGINAAYPSNLTNFNGTMFFTANDGRRGAELWKSDGTKNGTILVKDINPGDAWSMGGGSVYNNAPSVSSLAISNGILYFVADDGIHGSELWQTDGTEDGTEMVADIHPGAEGANIENLFDVNGTLFFKADDGTNGRGMWVLRSETVEPPIPGDSNHDGIFNSSDFVEVFKAGKYEDGIPGNATFEEGDWDGNGDFDSGDFVFVFQKGNYVAAARPADADIDTVLAAISSRDWNAESHRQIRNAAVQKPQQPVAAARSKDVLAVDLAFAAVNPHRNGKATDAYEASMRNPALNGLEELMI